MSFIVLVIGGDPVLRDGLLCGTNLKLPNADHVAHKS
jgi:hypothetical protein